jgi:hypothetical protein
LRAHEPDKNPDGYLFFSRLCHPFDMERARRANDQIQQVRESKTLGDLLYTKQVERPTSEAAWIRMVQSIAEGDQLALQSIYELTHRIVFTLIMRILSIGKRLRN